MTCVKISYRKLLLIGDKWNIKIFCLSFYDVAGKKGDAERFGDPLHIVLPPAPKKDYFHLSKVQSRIGLMFLCIYMLINVQPYTI